MGEFDPTKLSPEDAANEAERRTILRELGLPFSTPLSLAQCRARRASRNDGASRTPPSSVSPSASASAPATAASSPPTSVVPLDARPPAAPLAIYRADTAEITVGDPPLFRRTGDMLELVLLAPPRTKKNSTNHPAQQSLGYRRFRNYVATTLRSHREALGLPLPEGTYNVEAVFFTDNEQADTQGLIQGLADALENADVITNDRQLRTWDGTDQFVDRVTPRVEVRITPRPLASPRSLGLYRSWRQDAPVARQARKTGS